MVLDSSSLNKISLLFEGFLAMIVMSYVLDFIISNYQTYFLILIEAGDDSVGDRPHVFQMYDRGEG